VVNAARLAVAAPWLVLLLLGYLAPSRLASEGAAPRA
jgi:hypothetical protein